MPAMAALGAFHRAASGSQKLSLDVELGVAVRTGENHAENGRVIYVASLGGESKWSGLVWQGCRRFTHRRLPCHVALPFRDNSGGGRAAGAGRYVPWPKRYPLAKTRSRRSEEHTSELQSLMRISYAVFCLKKK